MVYLLLNNQNNSFTLIDGSIDWLIDIGFTNRIFSRRRTIIKYSYIIFQEPSGELTGRVGNFMIGLQAGRGSVDALIWIEGKHQNAPRPLRIFRVVQYLPDVSRTLP